MLIGLHVRLLAVFGLIEKPFCFVYENEAYLPGPGIYLNMTVLAQDDWLDKN